MPSGFPPKARIHDNCRVSSFACKVRLSGFFLLKNIVTTRPLSKHLSLVKLSLSISPPLNKSAIAACLLISLGTYVTLCHFKKILISFHIKVSDFSRKPFCFRSVFYYYYYFFTFFLLQLHRPVISSSILNGFTSNFQDIIIMTRQCTVWILRRIPQGVGTGRGPKF